MSTGTETDSVNGAIAILYSCFVGVRSNLGATIITFWYHSISLMITSL